LSAKKKRGPKSRGLTESAVLVRMPHALKARVEADAKKRGISVRAWWREAASVYLIGSGA